VRLDGEAAARELHVGVLIANRKLRKSKLNLREIIKVENKIHGNVMQALDVQLQQGESIYTESGGMAWMSGNIAMDTNTKGGVMAGLGRECPNYRASSIFL
jgi:phage terminase large subunit-like protein